MRAPAPALVLLTFAAPGALAQFVEPDAVALWSATSGGTHGWAVSELADIDGDGAMDAIAGAPTARQSRGRAHVYSGATGVELFVYESANPGDRIGHAVADAGDVDADGFHDVVAGGNTMGGTGGVVVLSGNPASYGQVILQVAGLSAASQFGYAVAGLGDTNGDGRSDLLVGAPASPGSTIGEGRAYILSGADGSVLHELEGSATTSALFGQGCASIGDVDGDGVSDGAVGAPGEGRAYVYSGATGLLILPALVADPGNSVFGQFFVGQCNDVTGDGTPDIYVGDYNASKGYVFSGADGSRALVITDAPTDGLGCGRGYLADINRDGHADLCLGSYTDSAGAPSAGRITVFSGADGSVLRTITGSLGAYQLGFDCVGVGDVNADGWPDILASAANRSTIYLVLGVNPCPADLDADGDLDTDDTQAFVAAFLAGDLVADFDHDGRLDLDDINAFVGAFLAGCP